MPDNDATVQTHIHNIQYLLLLRGNDNYANARQCYVTRTLPVLLYRHYEIQEKGFRLLNLPRTQHVLLRLKSRHYGVAKFWMYHLSYPHISMYRFFQGYLTKSFYLESLHACEGDHSKWRLG
jgi:hypothetical protein